MPKVNRNDPKRAASSESTYSLMEFAKAFPDDAPCLEWLWRTRFSPDGKHAWCEKCKDSREFKRYKTKQGRHSWTCTACGVHKSATAGTIYHGSATSLHLWFYAAYLMTSTRCGISAKQLEREIGVTYKCAWRMLNKLRNIAMADESGPPSGDVETDETSVDLKPRKQLGQSPYIAVGPERRSAAAKERERGRATVFAAVERGGRIKATVLPSRRGPQLKKQVIESVTNTVEGFFGHLKPAIRGTYRTVSHRRPQGYLSEFTFRRNARLDDQAMFQQLLSRAAGV